MTQEEKQLLLKDLEEAAWKYAPDLTPYNIGGGYLPPQSICDLRTAFKDGAEWQKSKMLELIETRISEIIGDAQPSPVLRMELQGIIDKIKIVFNV